jgi:hypothetical protein
MTRIFQPLLRFAAVLTAVWAYYGAFADEPGALASPTEKLDYLLSTWKGKSLEQLHDTWGHEESVERRGTHQVFVFERRVKVRLGLGSITVHGEQGGLRCVAKFEVDDEISIVRATRLGGGQDCWNLFRKYDPPS